MKKLPYIAILLLLLVIFFQPYGCQPDPPTPKVDTVIVYKHITDTIVVEKPVIIASIPDTVWLEKEENTPDTTYAGLLFQYKLLGSRHFTTNVFKVDFPISDYGSVTVTDSIYGNWLMNSTLTTNLNIPTTTITIEKEASKRNEFYVGGQLSMSKTYPISGIYGSALLKTKKDRIYHVSLGFNGETQILGGLYYKIKIK